MSRAQSPLLAYAKIITDFMVIYRGATKRRTARYCNKADRKSIIKADEVRVVFNVSTEDFHVIDVTISDKLTAIIIFLP